MSYKLNVLYQSDDNYSIYMGVSICSLLENNKQCEEIAVYIIDDDISATKKKELEKLIYSYQRELFFIDAREIVGSNQVIAEIDYKGERKNTHSFLKLFWADILPADIERVVYIDCDTIVAGDLSELTNISMGSCPLGMALDSLTLKAKDSIGFCTEDYYYNSGIILFNRKNWDMQDATIRMIEHIQSGKTYGTVDQDILNVVFKDQILKLPAEYNLQPIHLRYDDNVYFRFYPHKSYYDRMDLEKARKYPKIIHFLRYIGESPWDKGNVHPATKYFDYYLELSPWKNFQKVKRKKKWIFDVEKLLYLLLPPKVFLYIFVNVHEQMIRKSNKK